VSIEIDKRSDESAYIKVGDLTVYVEHSFAAPEFIHIWRNENEEIKKQAYIFKCVNSLFFSSRKKDAWVSSLGVGNNS